MEHSRTFTDKLRYRSTNWSRIILSTSLLGMKLILKSTLKERDSSLYAVTVIAANEMFHSLLGKHFSKKSIQLEDMFVLSDDTNSCALMDAIILGEKHDGWAVLKFPERERMFCKVELGAGRIAEFCDSPYICSILTIRSASKNDANSAHVYLDFAHGLTSCPIIEEFAEVSSALDKSKTIKNSEEHVQSSNVPSTRTSSRKRNSANKASISR